MIIIVVVVVVVVIDGATVAAATTVVQNLTNWFLTSHNILCYKIIIGSAMPR